MADALLSPAGRVVLISGAGTRHRRGDRPPALR